MRRLFVLLTMLLAMNPAAEARYRFKEPPPDQSAPVYFSGRYPKARAKWSAYKVPDSYYGITLAGPASTTSFVGPTGMQVVSLQRDSRGRASPRLFITDIPGVFTALGFPAATPEQSSIPHYEFTPVIGYEFNYLFHGDNVFVAHCSLNAAFVSGGKEQWKARYMVQDATLYDISDAALEEKLGAHIKQCYARGADLFERHRRQGKDAFQDVPGLRVNGKKWPFPAMADLLPDRLVYLEDMGAYELDMSFGNWTIQDEAGQ